MSYRENGRVAAYPGECPCAASTKISRTRGANVSHSLSIRMDSLCVCVCVCAHVSAYVQKRTENSCTLYNTQLYVLTTLLAEALVDWPPDLECQLYPAQTDHPERFGIYMC